MRHRISNSLTRVLINPEMNEFWRSGSLLCHLLLDIVRVVLRGRAQVTETIFIVKTYISHHFCLWKPQNGIFQCKVGKNAILGLRWEKMARTVYVFTINIYCLSDLWVDNGQLINYEAASWSCCSTLCDV